MFAKTCASAQRRRRHELPRVDRDAARDEEQVARPNRVGVVADRLSQRRDADLLAAAHAPRDRAQRRPRRDRLRVDRSASTAGGRVERALERGRELVGALDVLAVRAERPRSAAKSGLTRSVPTTRPGKCRSWCMRIVPYMPLSTTRIDDRQLVLHGGRELLARHQEVAVAGEADHGRARARAPSRRPPPARRSPSRRSSARAGSGSRASARSDAPRRCSCRRRS